MEDKKEYTPQEVAEAILQKAKEVLQEGMDKSVKGVHTSGGFSGLESEGRSQAGNEITSRAPKAGNKYLKEMHHERGKQMHREKLQELKDMPKPNLPKSEEMDKMAPENKNFAQAAELNVPQPKTPQATEKVIAKRPLELKKFAQKIAVKKALK